MLLHRNLTFVQSTRFVLYSLDLSASSDGLEDIEEIRGHRRSLNLKDY